MDGGLIYAGKVRIAVSSPPRWHGRLVSLEYPDVTLLFRGAEAAQVVAWQFVVPCDFAGRSHSASQWSREMLTPALMESSCQADRPSGGAEGDWRCCAVAFWSRCFGNPREHYAHAGSIPAASTINQIEDRESGLFFL